MSQLKNNSIRALYGLIPAIKIIKKWDMLKNTNQVDYIQKLSKCLPRHSFFVCNDQWGLLDKSFNIIIPAQYDNLEWHKKGAILRTNKNGNEFYLTTKGTVIYS